MIGAYLLILPFKRETDSLNLLFLAAYIILLFHPLSLYLASFQLSFMAVFFIIYFYPKLARKQNHSAWGCSPPSKFWRFLHFLKRKALLSISISFITILGTAPILAFHFHKVYLAGLIANLIMVPLLGFIVVSLGLLTIFIYFFGHMHLTQVKKYVR
jgi:competence protein ComEC